MNVKAHLVRHIEVCSTSATHYLSIDLSLIKPEENIQLKNLFTHAKQSKKYLLHLKSYLLFLIFLFLISPFSKENLKIG